MYLIDWKVKILEQRLNRNESYGLLNGSVVAVDNYIRILTRAIGLLD